MNILNPEIDNNLIAQIRNGNKVAFKILFEKYGARLYQFSLKYLRDKEDAEDLLNEVFLKIWENRLSLKTNTSFQSYLFTIAYNNIRQRFLKKNREEKYIQLFAHEYLNETSKGEDQLDYLLFAQQLDTIISLLPSRRKEIFKLSYTEEFKNNEIAKKLNISEQFVKNQLSIAKRFILDKIKENSNFAELLFFYLFTSGK